MRRGRALETGRSTVPGASNMVCLGLVPGSSDGAGSMCNAMIAGHHRWSVVAISPWGSRKRSRPVLAAACFAADPSVDPGSAMRKDLQPGRQGCQCIRFRAEGIPGCCQCIRLCSTACSGSLLSHIPQNRLAVVGDRRAPVSGDARLQVALSWLFLVAPKPASARTLRLLLAAVAENRRDGRPKYHLLAAMWSCRTSNAHRHPCSTYQVLGV